LGVGVILGIEEYDLFQCISRSSQNKIREILIFGPRVSRVPKFPAEYYFWISEETFSELASISVLLSN
jgi:hypothetical protein